MGNVSVILSVGRDDKLTNVQDELMSHLLGMFPLSNNAVSADFFHNTMVKSLERAILNEGTVLTQRPLLLQHVLRCSDDLEKLVVILPIGTTWAAFNALYSVPDIEHMESFDLQCVAERIIYPYLDAYGQFSRYPCDHQIAQAMIATVIKMKSRGCHGRGDVVGMDSLVLDRIPVRNPEGYISREGRQLAVIVSFKRIPY